ncbi:hypothetical protein IMZ48_02435 [Candidatus Bathyarchaeota archaeon]|nr:hypothetical protein [Candidatus Bathyarchaeota archaeon]
MPPGASDPQPGTVPTYWAGELSDGVVVAFSGAGAGGTFSVDFADVPGLEAGSYNWKELHSGEEGSGESISFDVALDDLAVFKVTSA